MKCLQIGISSLLLIVMIITLVPFDVHAQYGRRGDRDEWRDYWRNTDEGSDIDEGEVREWRRRNSAIRDAISDLDDDPVENLPIPVLFGVSVDDLVPNFGDPRDGGARTHEGLDMLVPEGTPVVSPTEAVVIRIGRGSGSGNYVSTANPGDETFVYMHLDRVADIDEGDRLDVGDLIGYVGNTGNAAGGPAHLHFELREDRRATDPLPRLTEEFTLSQKLSFLEDILDEVNDEDELAAFLTEEYLGVFLQARAQGLLLPELIAQGLPGSTTRGGGVFARDLTLESEGEDVTALQSILVAGGYLRINAPTGYFGPLTEAALAAYQADNNILPAVGYFGPITRSHFAGSGASGGDQLSEEREALVRQIAELTAQVEELQRQLVLLIASGR